MIKTKRTTDGIAMRCGGLSRLVMVLMLLVPIASSQAIIIRHDKADSRYRVDEIHYPQLFFLHTRFDNKVCIATLISPRWAITAAHCTTETPLLETVSRQQTFGLTIARKSVAADKVVLHPLSNTGDELQNVDLALIHMTEDVGHVVPATLNAQRDESNQVYALLGWGYSGIGTRGLQGNDGRFRRAENRVSTAGQWLEFLFDDPREAGNQALELEGIPSLGDSGGPALLETGGGLIVVGIAVGELEEGEPPDHQGRYGTVQLYERISSHLEWIEKVISE